MNVLPLTASCPGCHSQNVVYSCYPACCFNHVCSDCLQSFELCTRPLGGTWKKGPVPIPERDSTGPTAPCARCESLNVFQIDEGPPGAPALVCLSCYAMLEVGITE